MSTRLSTAIAALALAPAAWGNGFDYGLTPREIAPDTYVLEGAREDFDFGNGGNIVNTAFIVTADGVLVIDSGPSKRYGEQLRAAIGTVTDQPVKRVVITHHHPDHFLGNQAFTDVPIATLPKITGGIDAEGDGFTENLYRLVGNWMLGTEQVLPDETISEGTFEIGGHEISFLALSGHTAADLVVLDHTTGVLFAGDLVFNRRAPTTPHADIETWIESLDLLGQMKFSLVVPGHGPVAEGAGSIERTRDYLLWLQSALQEAADSGLELTELMYSPIPDRFLGEMDVLPAEYRRSVGYQFPALERGTLRGAPAVPE